MNSSFISNRQYRTDMIVTDELPCLALDNLQETRSEDISGTCGETVQLYLNKEI